MPKLTITAPSLPESFLSELQRLIATLDSGATVTVDTSQDPSSPAAPIDGIDSLPPHLRAKLQAKPRLGWIVELLHANNTITDHPVIDRNIGANWATALLTEDPTLRKFRLLHHGQTVLETDSPHDGWTAEFVLPDGSTHKAKAASWALLARQLKSQQVPPGTPLKVSCLVEPARNIKRMTLKFEQS